MLEEDRHNRSNALKTLKNRAAREFYCAEENITDEIRDYLKSLVHTFPFRNHILDDNGDRLPPEHLQQFCMFAIDDHGEIQLKNLIDSAFEISNDFRMRSHMPVSNLVHLPRTDCFKAEIGGRPRPSHTYDYDLFGVVLSYHGVTIGISPGQYRNLVADKIAEHQDELDAMGTVDDDPYWDARIKELMVNNLASFYLAKGIVSALRRIPKASLAELRPAQTNANIFSNNHMVVLDSTRVEPTDLIAALHDHGIVTCSIVSIGGDVPAHLFMEDSHDSKLWTEGLGEGYCNHSYFICQNDCP